MKAGKTSRIDSYIRNTPHSQTTSESCLFERLVHLGPYKSGNYTVRSGFRATKACLWGDFASLFSNPMLRHYMNIHGRSNPLEKLNTFFGKLPRDV